MQKLSWCKLPSLILVLCSTGAFSSQAQTILHSFDTPDGAHPTTVLAQGTDGNLYGATTEGGTFGGGTAFKITPAGSLTTLYNFCYQYSCTDGSAPGAGLVQTADGSLYGTTVEGGINGAGTIFKVTPSGALTTLHSFTMTDGFGPAAALVQTGNGDFYGSTGFGGAQDWGTIFKMTPSGTLTTLHSFDVTDGAFPQVALVQAVGGNLYGVTPEGGANNAGTVFKITLGGILTSLYSFCSHGACMDGEFPSALVAGTDGNFYGTTLFGGAGFSCASGCGTVFKVTPEGRVTRLHSFDSTDGYEPSGLTQGTDGNFYGTTSQGGLLGVGTVFKITSDGSLTTLANFDSNNGAYPHAGLVEGTNGTFYGTTDEGGASNACDEGGCGTVFSLSAGLGAFVETIPAFGVIGKSIVILGTDLEGANSVTFNGTPASFTVESATAIKTTVPTGATTGPVQVVTPSGTLTSNVNFQVLP